MSNSTVNNDCAMNQIIKKSLTFVTGFVYYWNLIWLIKIVIVGSIHRDILLIWFGLTLFFILILKCIKLTRSWLLNIFFVFIVLWSVVCAEALSDNTVVVRYWISMDRSSRLYTTIIQHASSYIFIYNQIDIHCQFHIHLQYVRITYFLNITTFSDISVSLAWIFGS